MSATLGARVRAVAWEDVAAALDARGFAVLPRLLTAGECRATSRLFDDDRRFRQTIDMARHRFGEGRYRYFTRPLPPLVAALRAAAYAGLAPIANAWHDRLGVADRFPPSLDAFTRACAAHRQERPTPLLLRYGPGGWNALHQDLYGEIVFPLQLAVLLDRPGDDFDGGEFLLVEQRPRTQSRGHVVPLARGDAVVFPCRERPVRGARGSYRAAMRHGVATVTAGSRTTLGVIFHDAR